jgi:hypothetical protein
MDINNLEFLLLAMFFFFHMLIAFGFVKGEQKKDNLNILICKNNITTIKSYWKLFTFKCQKNLIKNCLFIKTYCKFLNTFIKL